MSVTNFTDLKSSIADFLNRDDLTSVIPTFISLAEADMNRKLRHWRMERRSNATLDSQYSALPNDFLEPIRLMITGDNSYRLELISHGDLMDRREANNTTATPRYYAIIDGTIEVYPTPDQSYTLEMVYYSSLDALTSSNTTNWVITHHPDAYLYGALMHSSPYLAEDGRTQTWSTLFQNAIAGISMENERAKASGAGHRMRIRSF